MEAKVRTEGGQRSGLRNMDSRRVECRVARKASRNQWGGITGAGCNVMQDKLGSNR